MLACCSGSTALAVVKATDITKNLVNKTLTSEMVEEYARERLRVRAAKWQEKLELWKKQWNVKLDKNFKLESLSEKAFAQLCEIPFYIFAAGDDKKAPVELQNKHFSKLYVLNSDPSATEIYKKLFNCEIPKTHVARTIGYGSSAIVFINGLYPQFYVGKEFNMYWVYFFFYILEHELGHVEQMLDSLALYAYAHKYYENNKNIAEVAECLISCKQYLSFLPRPYNDLGELLYLPARLAYELCAFFEQWKKNEHTSLKDLENYSFFSVEQLKQVSLKREGEADKRAYMHLEYPMLAYYDFKNQEDYKFNENVTITSEEYFAEEGPGKGYYSLDKTNVLLMERFVNEGYLKGRTYVPCDKTKVPAVQKFIWWPSEKDKHVSKNSGEKVYTLIEAGKGVVKKWRLNFYKKGATDFTQNSSDYVGHVMFDYSTGTMVYATLREIHINQKYVNSTLYPRLHSMIVLYAIKHIVKTNSACKCVKWQTSKNDTTLTINGVDQIPNYGTNQNIIDNYFDIRNLSCFTEIKLNRKFENILVQEQLEIKDYDACKRIQRTTFLKQPVDIEFVMRDEQGLEYPAPSLQKKVYPLMASKLRSKL